MASFAHLKGRSPAGVFATVYDSAFAALAVRAGADGLIVGDTVGPVALGLSSVDDVTFGMLSHHAAAVRRGAPEAIVIADMPVSVLARGRGAALDDCRRMIDETEVDALKIEGASSDVLQLMGDATRIGISVVGHLEGAMRPEVEDARRVFDAGAVALVLVGMESDVAGRMTQAVAVPTIGKNAGRQCDAQVVNVYQALGVGGTGTEVLELLRGALRVASSCE